MQQLFNQKFSEKLLLRAKLAFILPQNYVIMLKHCSAFIACILMACILMAQPVKKAGTFFQNGIKLGNKGLYNEAISSFKKAIALNKKYDSAYLEMGMTYAKISKPDSAIMVLKNAVTIMPGFANAYIAMGNIYRDVKKNQDEAIANYLSALNIDSTNKVTLYSLAWSNNAKQYYREAVKYALKALAIDNNYKPAYNELGHAYRQLNAYEEAIVQFRKNLAVSYNELPLLYIGYCHLELNQKDEALKVYEELKKTNVKMAEGLRKKIDAKQ
jgi:tetratricopeptide (TPR) repeat protein